MSEIVAKKEFHCKNCNTILPTGVTECPRCKLKRLVNYSQFYALASDDAKQVIESYERERKCDHKAQIKKLLETAESWRHNKDYNEEYLKDIFKALCLNDDGEVVVKEFGTICTAKKTRRANCEKVFEYTLEAAKLGSLKALASIGKWYLGGYACKRQTMNAIALLCRAASAGDEEAYRLLVQGDEFYADDFFTSRIPSDILDRSSFDDYYINNLTNVKFWEKRKDPITELEQFAASNMLWAEYVLGEMYLRGNEFVQKDFQKGVGLILDAADKGPFNVQRAIQRKAMLQFDKLIDLRGKNNVDAAVETHWRIRNLRVRREAQAEILSRTSVFDSTDGKVNLLITSRGAQLIWRAIKQYKEAYNASWIMLPDSDEKCKKLSKGMFGYDWEYRGAGHEVRKDGKVYKYRAPFLGKDGFTGTHGLCFDSWSGLCGNIHYKGHPAYNKFEYGSKYNFKIGTYETSALEDVDVWWLFREPECYKDRDTKKMHVCWMYNEVADFKPAGFTEADLLHLIEFVRRYVLSDLRKGVKLSDGSMQKGQFASKIDIPMEPSQYTLSLCETIGVPCRVEKVEPKKDVSKKDGSGDSKPALADTSSRSLPSTKKRWLFILIGLFFGLFGLHFLYARRKGWFAFYWLMVIANVVHMKVPAVANLVPALSNTPIFAMLAGLTLVGSIFFMKKDGDGNRM